jgi:hypothetical protein
VQPSVKQGVALTLSPEKEEEKKTKKNSVSVLKDFFL